MVFTNPVLWCIFVLCKAIKRCLKFYAMRSPACLVDLKFTNLNNEADVFETRIASHLAITFPDYIFNEELEKEFKDWAKGKALKREQFDLVYPLSLAL